jgi:hypothetical protein
VSDSRPVRANEAVHRAVGGPRRGLPGMISTEARNSPNR